MNKDDETRLAGIQRAATNHIQRYARSFDHAKDSQVEALMQKMRSYIVGLKDGLILMGMTDTAAREVIRKAGWDFSTNSYVLYERKTIFGQAA